MLTRLLLAFIFLASIQNTAWSQAATTGAFMPGLSTSISATTSTSNVSLPGTGPVAVVQNTGSVTAYITIGTASSLTATTAGFPVQAGMVIAIAIPAPGYMAGITASGSTTLLVTQGSGGPNLAFEPNGGGVAVTVNQGTSPWIVSGSGTAGTAATGVVSVQGIASMTPVQVSQATATNLNATTINNPSATAAAATAPVVTSVLATSLVLKASAGNLYGLNVSADSTLSGAAWWVMVHNAAAAPAAGAVTPTKCYALALGTTMASLAFPTPVRFSTGVSVTVSTTGCFTQTDSVHAFISGDAQ